MHCTRLLWLMMASGACTDPLIPSLAPPLLLVVSSSPHLHLSQPSLLASCSYFLRMVCLAVPPHGVPGPLAPPATTQGSPPPIPSSCPLHVSRTHPFLHLPPFPTHPSEPPTSRMHAVQVRACTPFLQHSLRAPFKADTRCQHVSHMVQLMHAAMVHAGEMVHAGAMMHAGAMVRCDGACWCNGALRPWPGRMGIQSMQTGTRPCLSLRCHVKPCLI